MSQADDAPLHIRAQVTPEGVSPTDWGELWKMQEAQNRASHVHQHHLAAQIAELSLHQDASTKRLAHIDSRIAAIEAAVQENTELTRGIRDAITAGRVATTAVKWLAGLVVTLASAWLAIKGLGKDPGP